MSVIEAFFDGCCEPINPGGTASYGVVILQDGKRIWETSKIVTMEKGKEKYTSNNVAEYSGFKAILDYLLSHDLHRNVVIIRGDSNLVIHQMFGTWKIKSGYYVPIALLCRQILKQFPNITGEWIRRDENYLADELSKARLIEAGIKFRIQPQTGGTQ